MSQVSEWLSDEIGRVAGLSPAQLRQEWERVFKRPPPMNYSPDLLRRMLAHRLQERRSGGPHKGNQRRLGRLLKCTAGSPPLRDEVLRPGTRLARDWQGATHHVMVTGKGFEYREQTFRSLSGVARAITGVAWSGPRFFGLLPGQRSARDAAR